LSVAVAVVSFNTRALLERCLASLAGEDAEVWVVDNGSTDGSAEMVRSEFPRVRLVEASENAGFGRAVNLVAGRTDTRWLVAANADTAATPGALSSLLAAGDADPGAGALTPRLVLPDGSTQHSVHPFPTLPFTTAFALGAASALGDRLCLEGHWDPDRARRVPWAVGAFLLLRRSAWNAVGGFDERRWMYAEDLDLGWRLHRAGWATRHVPDAVVHHDESAATAAAWGDERTQRWMDATYAWMRDTRGAARARAVAAVNVAGAGARAAALAPLARARPERFAYRRDTYASWARAHARAGLHR
jgi:N-acetylglucosaminyl-diphospho-decaprenol L-rhamnosyltransferase